MAAVAAGRVAVLSAVVVAVAPLLLAGVARADCFDYCFKNCVANDKSMTDYCNYACDKTCEPGASQQPLLTAAGGDMGCQLSCARTSCNCLRPDCKAMETCFEMCYDGSKTKTLPRTLLAGAGVPTALGPLSGTGHSRELYPLFPALEPDPDDAASEERPFHQKQDAVRPASEPDPDNALLPASEPDPDDAIVLLLRQSRKMTPFGHLGRRDPDVAVHPRSASNLDGYFHEKQDGVNPASEPNKDDGLPSSEIHAAPPAPV